MMPVPDAEYITRGELSGVQNEMHGIRERVAVIESQSTATQATMNQILTIVQKQGGARNAIITACSSLGGGLAVGLYALLHSLGKI